MKEAAIDMTPRPKTPHLFHFQTATLKTIFNIGTIGIMARLTIPPQSYPKTLDGIPRMDINTEHESNITVLAMGRRINQTVKNLPRFLSIGISSSFYFATKVLHLPYIDILKRIFHGVLSSILSQHQLFPAEAQNQNMLGYIHEGRHYRDT
jgi:hypothetical protein